MPVVVEGNLGRKFEEPSLNEGVSLNLSSALAVLVFMQITAAQADTARFVTGIEYQEIIPAQQTRAPQGMIEVVELFWYGCPHCYRLEDKGDLTLKKWLKNKPDNVYFYKLPAQFNKHWEIHAAAYYTAQSLGVLDKVHMDIFKAVIKLKPVCLNLILDYFKTANQFQCFVIAYYHCFCQHFAVRDTALDIIGIKPSVHLD